MKIANIVGSPRPNGSGAAIAGALLLRLPEAGLEIKTHVLNQLIYRGCQACMACKTTSEQCVVKDDLAAVLEDVRTADVVLISAPIYFGEIAAQAKGLVDRFYSFLSPDFKTNPRPGRLTGGKQVVFIVPQGNPDESFFKEVIVRYQRSFLRLGFDRFYAIRARGAGPGNDVVSQEKIIQAITETAGKVLETYQDQI
jgi:multimeric flavodoxin WrbA